MADEWACKPGSVRSDRDPSATVISLGSPLPTTSSGLPGSSDGPPSNASCLTLLRMGFAKPPESPRALVGSYSTVSPLPPGRGQTAVCSLWHFPAGHPGSVLPTTLPFGARTFLGDAETSTRPSGPLVRDQSMASVHGRYARPDLCECEHRHHDHGRNGQHKCQSAPYQTQLTDEGRDRGSAALQPRRVPRGWRRLDRIPTTVADSQDPRRGRRERLVRGATQMPPRRPEPQRKWYAAEHNPLLRTPPCCHPNATRISRPDIKTAKRGRPWQPR